MMRDVFWKWTVIVIVGGPLVVGIAWIVCLCVLHFHGVGMSLNRITRTTDIVLPESAKLLKSNYRFAGDYLLHAKVEMSSSDVDVFVDGLREWGPIKTVDSSSEEYRINHEIWVTSHRKRMGAPKWWDPETFKQFTLIVGNREGYDDRGYNYHQRMNILIPADTPRPVVYIYWE